MNSELIFGLSEPQIRTAVFCGLFAILAVLEFLVPRRTPKPVKGARWFTNWVIVIIDSVVVRLVFASAAVGGALWANMHGIGLFNWLGWSGLVTAVISFVILDFAVWLSHVASHKIPVFWKIHRMHHSDIDFDVTTAIRFHPIEVFLSMIWKYAVVVALGAPAVAVLIFEIVLNGAAIFNHSNWRLPPSVDRYLRWIVVTPDMHRVHHSIIHNETDSNYGFNLSIWDRIFSTYVDQPKAGHENMTIGLSEWQDHRPTGLLWTLKIPFMGKSSRL